MNNVWLLTKVLLKNGSNTIRKKGNKFGRVASKLGLGFLLLLAFLPLMIMIFGGTVVAYKMLSESGQQPVVLNTMMWVMSATTFVFGIITVMTYFYFTSGFRVLFTITSKTL